MRNLIIDKILSSKWYTDLEDAGEVNFTLARLSNESLLEIFEKTLTYY
jgi:hypothetical protein